MTRACLAVCAGGCLTLFLAGCAGTNLRGLFVAEREMLTGDEVVAGSLEAVGTSTQGKLAGLGLHAVLTHEGEAIHIASTTKSGATFTLVLTREMTQQGEQTRIRLKWGNGYDKEAAVQILSEVTAKATR